MIFFFFLHWPSHLVYDVISGQRTREEYCSGGQLESCGAFGVVQEECGTDLPA